MGRPTKYDTAFNAQAEKLCKLGATDEDMADFFGVDVTTIDRWKARHAEFRGAIKAGKKIADMEVAQSLHSRAVGHRWTEQQAFRVKTGQYAEKVEVVDVERELPPDPTSMIFWLKNRDKANWRDRVTHEGDPDNPVVSRIETVIVRAGNADH